MRLIRSCHLLFQGKIALALLAGLMLFSLAGCGTLPGMPAPARPAIQGAVYGGQPPVAYATIQFYAAGDTDYGSDAKALLDPPVTTDSTGHFSFTDYTCPSDSSQVYLVATGGNPGLPAGMTNPALTMMAALGPCSEVNDSTYVNITEVTTVASVYALAPFMKPGGGTKLGTSPGNALGLANAFATVNNLVNTRTGTAPGPNLPSGATAPIAELNTLAGILASCVNSSGTSGECDALFADAAPEGASQPNNTIDAVLDIALNPGHHVGEVFSHLAGTPPFLPTLGEVPNDWTVAASYTTGGSNYPFSLAIDSQGNIWTGDLQTGGVSKLSNTGATISPAEGYTGAGPVGSPFKMAIDNSDDIWLASAVFNSLLEYSNDGTPISPPGGFTGGGLDTPDAIAVDGGGNIWASNFVSWTLSKFSPNGDPITGSVGYGGGGLNQSEWDIAVDGNGDIWLESGGAPYNLAEFSNNGMALSPSSDGYTDDGLEAPLGVAVDHAGNAWTFGTTGLYKFSSTGVPLSGSSGYSDAGGVWSRCIAIDGDGNVWGGYGSEYANNGAAVSPPTGYVGDIMISPAGIAVDSSGNVWIADESNGAVVEIVGVAGPVVTPLGVAVKLGKVAARP